MGDDYGTGSKAYNQGIISVSHAECGGYARERHISLIQVTQFEGTSDGDLSAYKSGHYRLLSVGTNVEEYQE